jgi:ssDNA-binding Zn-finger/Zn-ribbon topoisomerase 1
MCQVHGRAALAGDDACGSKSAKSLQQHAAKTFHGCDNYPYAAKYAAASTFHVLQTFHVVQEHAATAFPDT